MSEPIYGSISPSWQKVIDLWDLGHTVEHIAEATGYSAKFVQIVTCTLDDRDDVPRIDIREATMLLGARIAQCFPHRPDMRRRAA